MTSPGARADGDYQALSCLTDVAPRHRSITHRSHFCYSKAFQRLTGRQPGRTDNGEPPTLMPASRPRSQLPNGRTGWLIQCCLIV